MNQEPDATIDRQNPNSGEPGGRAFNPNSPRILLGRFSAGLTCGLIMLAALALLMLVPDLYARSHDKIPTYAEGFEARMATMGLWVFAGGFLIGSLLGWPNTFPDDVKRPGCAMVTLFPLISTTAIVLVGQGVLALNGIQNADLESMGIGGFCGGFFGLIIWALVCGRSPAATTEAEKNGGGEPKDGSKDAPGEPPNGP